MIGASRTKLGQKLVLGCRAHPFEETLLFKVSVMVERFSERRAFRAGEQQSFDLRYR
ncbi:MAG: hypothetical protein H0V78_10605, partial [Burkholderiales bacterium]|nr:hypothetical protein [Burkholderiales bacterium]